jgi:hypothetical protein
MSLQALRFAAAKESSQEAGRRGEERLTTKTPRHQGTKKEKVARQEAREEKGGRYCSFLSAASWRRNRFASCLGVLVAWW